MTSTTYPSSRQMPVDLYRDGDTYRLDADLPGVDPSTVDIAVDGQLLTIRAERTQKASDDAKWLARGRQSGAFERRFTLGQGVDRDSIAASYDNGVLSLSIPVSEKAKPRKIEVVSSAVQA
jgi:HSP20 family protein